MKGSSKTPFCIFLGKFVETFSEMRFDEFPFLRYVIFFILGTLLYPTLLDFISIRWIKLALLIVFLKYLILILINHRSRMQHIRAFLPILAYSQLVLFGVLFTYERDIENATDHMMHMDQDIKGYLALVLSNDEAKPNSFANTVSVRAVYDGEKLVKSKGEVLIYHRDKSKLEPGELLWIAGSPQAISKPNNPFEFDYARFMLRQQISHQHFIADKFERIGFVKEIPISSFFMKLRAGIMEQIDLMILDHQANQIAKALLLGQKKSLDKEVSDAYATAGAMHVLAVSGLHVGIIFGFFFMFVKPYRLSVGKRVIYLSGLILLIWSYAMLTGMSPSVMRAATMFSLMAMAQMKSRSPSIFNSIALSAIILLVFDPFLIYAVGFQLSYAALLGILIIQPILVRLWLPKNRLLEYAWQISTVGIAAQLATFPISVYYFQVFPVYFILSNLVAIPGAFLIMSFGVPFMLLSKIPFLGAGLAWISEKLIIMVNTLIFWVQDLPFSRISEIYVSSKFVWFYVLALGATLILIFYPNRKLLYGLTAIVAGLILLRPLEFLFKSSQKELVFYGLEKGMAIDYYDGKNLFSFDDLSDSDKTYKIQPYRARLKARINYPLLAFHSGDTLLVLLPDGKAVHLTKRELAFEGIGRTTKLLCWDNEKWNEVPMESNIAINGNAYKLVFD